MRNGISFYIPQSYIARRGSYRPVYWNLKASLQIDTPYEDITIWEIIFFSSLGGSATTRVNLSLGETSVGVL